MGLTIPSTSDIIFVQHSVYDTGLLLQFADCSYAIGRYNETNEAYQKLLSKEGLPDDKRALIKKNLAILKPQLKK
jgi:hypothetical protein